MMDGVKSLFLAMDQPRDEIISRLATTLRINTSLMSLWLLVPLTETSAMALADALRELYNFIIEPESHGFEDLINPIAWACELHTDDPEDGGITESEFQARLKQYLLEMENL